jgi:hypothetical protein
MITASVNIAPLLKKLQTLSLAIKQPMDELVRDQARLVISSSGKVPGLVQVTPPHSEKVRGNAAKKQGESRTRSDIRKVYGIPSDMYGMIKARDEKLAKVFWSMVMKHQWDEASALSQRITGYSLREFDGGAAHRSRRSGSSRGRVQSRSPFFFLRDPVGKRSALEDYIKRRTDRVGMLASGFNAAAAALSAKGMPSWVTRHGSQFSGVSIQSTPTSFYVIISDKVPFGQSDTVRRMDYILRYRSNALKRSMPYVIRSVMKKAGFTAVMT